MQTNQVLGLFNRWERELPVREWTVNGIRVWPLLRLSIGTRLQAASDAHRLPATGARSWLLRAQVIWDLKETVRAHVRDGAHDAALAPADALFLMHTTCRQRLDGSFYDMFCDPIADELERDGLRCLSLESAPLPARYRLPRHRASVLIQPEYVLANVKSQIGRSIKTWGPTRLQGYPELQSELRTTGTGVVAPSEVSLALQTARIQWLSSYFGVVLSRVQPRVAMSVCYYGDLGWAFNLAARRAGVLSVDLQHGGLEGNFAYDAFSSLPEDGFELLPDVFWCWSQRDAAVIQGWPSRPSKRHIALIGGQPWTCLWRDDSSEIVARTMARVDGMRMQAGECVVLLTLQWDQGLTDLMKQAICAAPGDLRFWIRLHPHMDSERAAIKAWVAIHAAGRCLVDEPTDLPLPVLLRRVDVHCTRHSTVVQEAAAAGVPSVILDEAGLDWYRAEREAGWVSLARDPAAVIAAIAEVRNRPRPDLPTAGLGTPETMRAALKVLLPGASRFSR